MMAPEYEDQPIDGLEALKALRRSDEQRQGARARILAAAEPLLEQRGCSATSFEVLAEWARPGLVAASVALLVFAAALQFGPERPSELQPVTLEDVLASGDAGDVPPLLVAINEPDADAVMAAALLENGNGGRVPEDSGEGQ
jgi:hypothetical protein